MLHASDRAACDTAFKMVLLEKRKETIMGIFNRFKKGEAKEEHKEIDIAIVAMAAGELIDVSTVSDPVFAGKALGESVAFRYEGDQVTICAPATGELSVVFPTGHAFGIKMDNGVELLVHIGISTVEADGDGFAMHNKKQGDRVSKGDEIVTVDLKKLRDSYDMATMLIVTEANGQEISFIDPGEVQKGQRIVK